jgi:oxalate decarboxylase/phosphoglucose isomerase-like protein (cupin superfamily)
MIITVAMVNLGPCSLLPPHIHPRAANYVVATLGNTTTYMWEENGAHLITTNLTPGKATLFPAGAMHMMVNTGTLFLVPVRTHRPPTHFTCCTR